MKKILKLSGKLMIFLFSAYLCLKFISYVAFNIHLKSEYSTYAWKGDWKSTTHKFEQGYFIADLPYSLPIHNVFNGNLVSYKTFYTLDQFFVRNKATVSGVVFPRNEMGGGTLLPDNLSIGFHAKLTFQDNKVMELTGTVNPLRTMITGSYRCNNPYDMGMFSLIRR